MFKYILLGILFFNTGCISGYGPQIVKVPRHKIKIYSSVVEVQNAYAQYNIRQTSTVSRDIVTGFFSHIDNTIHCPAPFPEECLLHEYKHLTTKYGLEIPDDPHFKRRR